MECRIGRFRRALEQAAIDRARLGRHVILVDRNGLSH
jgi:hypothetical protein